MLRGSWYDNGPVTRHAPCRLNSVARLKPGSGLEAVAAELGACASDIVLAALEAAGNLQDSLLCRTALGAGPGALPVACAERQMHASGSVPRACLQVPLALWCMSCGALPRAGGLSSGHELQAKARLLQSVWVACGRLVNFVGDAWTEKRSALYWWGTLLHPGTPACWVTALQGFPVVGHMDVVGQDT